MTEAERRELMTTAVRLSNLLNKHYGDLMKGVIPNTGGLHHYACAVGDLPEELSKIFNRIEVQEAEMDRRDRRTNIIVNRGLEDNPFDMKADVDAITKEEAVASAVIFTGEQVNQAWSQSKLSHLQLISTNKKYRGLPKAQWDRILELHLTAVERYEPELFDCDSFAACFLGFVAWDFDVNGVVRVLDTSAGHSYNAVLVASDDGKSCSWERIEPQADSYIDEDEQPRGIQVGHAPAGAYVATAGFAITA